MAMTRVQMRWFITFLVLAAAVAATAAAFLLPRKMEEGGFAVRGGCVRYEIASELRDREKGLSGRESLPEMRGLLLKGEADGFHGIWMPEMKFPIDVIWLDSHSRIVDVKRDLAPETYPEIYYPKAPARDVLEVSSGFFDLHGLRVGDVLEPCSETQGE